MKRIFVLLFLLASLNIFAQPVGYYNGTEGLRGDELKMKLHEIIRGHDALSYYFAKYVLYHSDADPLVPGNVILVYTGRSQDGLDYGSGGNKINREHVWAKSHGGFSGILPMDSDVHNLKPCDATANSARSNMDFDWSLYPHPAAPDCKYTPGTSWEPRDAVKGDIARIIFYMDARYKGTGGEMDLQVVDRVNTYPLPQHGKLSALLQWNVMDQPDQFERRRNDVIDHFQNNRNPFIDQPQFVDLIWGNAPLPEFAIGNIAISNQQPFEGDQVTISCTVEPAPQGNVRLFWGDSFNYLLEDTEMVFENGVWSGVIPAHPAGSEVYIGIRADNGSGLFSWSPVYKYRVAQTYNGDLTPIPEIQGSGNVSPYEGQIVTTTGTVTAFYRDGYFIQAGQGARTGLYIWDPWRFPAIGDSIVLSGEVKEHFGLTEIVNPSFYQLIKTDRKVPEPEVITVADVGEDWESVLIRIEDATCTHASHWNNFNMWRVSDGSGELNIQNNDVFSIDPVFNRNYTITGPLNYTYSEWKIELRNLQDVVDPTNVFEYQPALRLSIYPNPTDGIIIMQAPNTGAANPKFTVYDMLGAEKFLINIAGGTGEVQLDLRSQMLPDGMYLIVYTDAATRIAERVLLHSR